MEGTSRRNRTRLLLIVGALIGLLDRSAPRSSPNDSGDPPGDRSSSEPVEIRARFDARSPPGAICFSRLLDPRERAALARGYLRFKVDLSGRRRRGGPGEVGPVLDRRSRLSADQPRARQHRHGLEALSQDVCRPGGSGWVSTVSIARRWPTMSCSSGRSTGRDERAPRTIVSLDPHRIASWKTTMARPGSSAAHDAYKPFRRCPRNWSARSCSRPAHAERHSALLATGRVWKTHVVSSPLPDQVTIAFGSDPAARLGLDLEDLAGGQVDRPRIARPAGQPVARASRRTARTSAS